LDPLLGMHPKLHRKFDHTFYRGDLQKQIQK